MNKLSELSKPVAWEVKGILCHSEEEAQVYVGEPEPLYSQEYISALIKQAEKAEAFRDQMVKYVRTLGGSVISPSVVETILTAAERSKCVGDEQ
jgi:hypothetical protein